MDANEISSEAVVVLPYEDDGKEERAQIFGAMSREDDEGANKSISEMGEAALSLGEVNKKLSRDKTAEELVDTLLCEYEEGTKKASSQMDAESLPLEEDTNN